MEKFEIESNSSKQIEKQVTMSNALIRAGQGLTLNEKRLVMLAVSKLDSQKIIHPGELLPSIQITAQEYGETYGLDLESGAAYKALQDSAKHLFERKITFFEAAYKRNGKPIQPTRIDMRWVGECIYHEGEGWVQLAWWPRLVPSLVGLKKQFTSYQLEQASALRSVYSWRLLELLMRFKSTGLAEYDIEDFKASMDAPPSLTDFAQVKRRILNPAIKELEEKEGLKINWEPVKLGGKKVKGLRFTFSRKEPQFLLP